MASKHVFHESGPKDLDVTSVDWNNEHHRRVVMASLVKGSGVLERDRMGRREGSEALAPPWFESFGFRLENTFVEADGKILGAIYSYTAQPVQNGPSYVVAFRGMIVEPELNMRDVKRCTACIIHTLHESPCFNHAMQWVRHLVDAVGAPRVWLAGHSLGSAMAMLLGKEMARAEIRLETYLFNPLFISFPFIERIRNSELRFGIHFTKSMAKAGLSVILKGLTGRPPVDEYFAHLSTWVPNIFVHPKDELCSNYIGYFENRMKMVAIGVGMIEAIATQNSFRSLISGVFRNESKPLDILPSAYLTINERSYSNFNQAHGIQQWWEVDGTHFRSQRYMHDELVIGSL